MIRILGPGWMMTFLLFLGFCISGVFLYSQISRSVAQREFERCASQVASVDGNWKVRSQIALCRDLYHGSRTGSLGRYGPMSEATISLAMMRRPDFRHR